MSARTGRGREYKVCALLRSDGWVAYVTRSAQAEEGLGLKTSRGAVDVIASRITNFGWVDLRFIQVKTTAGGPFERFGPRERERFLAECALSGAKGELWWWPPRRRQPRIILASQWPGERERTPQPAL